MPVARAAVGPSRDESRRRARSHSHDDEQHRPRPPARPRPRARRGPALWVAWEEDRLAFLTGPGSRKARNVARDPRVSVSVAHTEQPWLMATLFGRVERLVDGEQGWAVVDRIAHLYTGGPYPREQDRVAFLVDVDRASAASFA